MNQLFHASFDWVEVNPGSKNPKASFGSRGGHGDPSPFTGNFHPVANYSWFSTYYLLDT